MAYLMIKKQFSLRQAFEFVKERRPNIGPRSNFMTQLCKLERGLTEQGVNFDMKNPDMLYSLPIQVYELSSMRCVNYEETIDFLLSKRKPSRLSRYRSFLRSL